MKHIVLLWLFLGGWPLCAFAQSVHTYLDLQTHPTMHVPHFFFGEGLRYFPAGDPPELSFKHQFTDVNYANYWQHNPGARIIVAGALTRETVRNSAKAKRVILDQLAYIRNFVNQHADHFALATSPQQVRDLFHTTDKTIIVFSIEGGKHLINDQADADFWAEQGIAFITLIHLVDSDLGTSGLKPGIFPRLINLKGSLRSQRQRGGLTEKGKNAIRWLARAGIMTDITHMSAAARADALRLMETDSIPLIATHELYRPIQNHVRGLTDEDIVRIYRAGGFISLPISGYALEPYQPEPRFQARLDSLTGYCDQSVDTYRFTYEAVQELLQDRHATITDDTLRAFPELSEQQKIDLSLGFQSDFNGWLNHSRPRYGKQGCWEAEPDTAYFAIETEGMPHPGLLDSQWRYLESEGVDLSPLRRNAEKFLQLWEKFLAR